VSCGGGDQGPGWRVSSGDGGGGELSGRLGVEGGVVRRVEEFGAEAFLPFGRDDDDESTTSVGWITKERKACGSSLKMTCRCLGAVRV
jgi:hypothetical protein